MKNLYKKMAEYGYTQSQLAEKINVSRTMISIMANNRTFFVNNETLDKLCEVLNCNKYELFSVEEVLTYQPNNKEEAAILVNKIKEEYKL